MPGSARSSAPATPTAAASYDATPLPQQWVWVEPVSAVRHVLELRSHVDGENASRSAVLGTGAFGQCLRVVDSCTGEDFCLKTPAAASRDAAAERCLRKEYQVMRRLNHPNVLRALALISSCEDTVLGLLLPLADGNLWTWLCQRSAADLNVDGARGTASGSAQAQLLAQVSRGLCYLHVCRVLHLDLKPENVLLTRRRSAATHTLRIADFGSSRAGQDTHGKGGERVQADIVNTEVYRPLHLFHCAGSLVRAHAAFDRWAFGCIVFDVAQGPERFRSRTGKPLRLFSGLPMREDMAMLRRARNQRLQRYVAERAVPLVLQCQPDKPDSAGSHGSAELCMACERLLLCAQ